MTININNLSIDENENPKLLTKHQGTKYLYTMTFDNGTTKTYINDGLTIYKPFFSHVLYNLGYRQSGEGY